MANLSTLLNYVEQVAITRPLSDLAFCHIKQLDTITRGIQTRLEDEQNRVHHIQPDIKTTIDKITGFARTQCQWKKQESNGESPTKETS